MLGEFWYNGMEVCTMLGRFGTMVGGVYHVRGVLVQWYGGLYHVRGVLVQWYGGLYHIGEFGTMVCRFVPC